MESRHKRGAQLLSGPGLWGLWLLVVLAVLSTAAGIGPDSIEPTGKTVGLIQFDVTTKLFTRRPGISNIVMFSRHWVCPEYYAVAFAWHEPLGDALRFDGLVVFSDETAFNIDDRRPWHPRVIHARHLKPLGPGPPLRHYVGLHHIRYAESEALAKRVYVSDFASAADQNETIDVNVPDRPGSVTRKLGHLKARVQHGRIESMELLDKDREPLATIRYEYDPPSGADCLSTLVAQLPVRHQDMLNAEPEVLPSGEVRTPEGTHRDYVRHKGGRTCTVRYRNVVLGAKHVRLPVQIEVRRSDSNELLRSAKLTNFKHVELDEAGVQRAAAAFAGANPVHGKWSRLKWKFLVHEAKLGPPSIDPNNLETVRRLIAKYPVFERPPGPALMTRTRGDHPPLTLDGYGQWFQEHQRRREKDRAEWQKRVDRWNEQLARTPRPPHQHVGEDDTRLIRQLYAHYKASGMNRFTCRVGV